MSWPSILVVALFLALWLGPLFLFRRAERHGRSPVAAIRIALRIYALAFLALALWWRVPFSAQYAVESSAASWVAAPRRQFDCAEIEAGAAALGRISDGQIEASDAGHLRLSADLWRRMPAPQRATIIDLAAQMRRCLGGDTSARGVAIYDIETNRILFEDR